MKKLTVFFTITLLVCIAIFVAFASNQNRTTSYSQLVREGPDDDFPGKFSEEYNSGIDGEGPLYSSGSSSFSYYRNNEGELKAAAWGYASVSCSTNNENYRTTYTLYAEVPSELEDLNVRNPEVQPKKGSFSDSTHASGDGNGNILRGGARGSATARGINPTNKDQNNTSAASPTPSTARDREIVDD